MTLGIGSFDIEMHVGYLSIQVGRGAQRWDLYWNHLHREFIICRGMETLVHWVGAAQRA
jgi:hypothetical protein